MFNFNLYRFRYYNLRLVLYVSILCASGVLFIKSATINSAAGTATKQILGVALGIVIMIVVSLIDYHWVLKYSWIWFIAGISLLILVLFIGTSGDWGASRWIVVPGIGTIQPSELYKIIMILFFAYFFENWEERINSVFVLLAALILFAIPVFLIYKEPDLSTTLVIVAIFLIMIYVANISYKWILGVIAAMIPIGTWFLYMIMQEGQNLVEEYQINRVLSFIFPERFPDLSHQTNYSVIAIASGMLKGKGLYNTTLESVKNGNFLLEADTDFIFAVIGEETGFIGSVAIVALFFLVVCECIYMAIRARDLSGRLICTGIASWIALQAFVNIGVATDLLPNTGLTLPFISAGLSSLISLFIAIGVVLNIGLQREREDKFKMGVLKR